MTLWTTKLSTWDQKCWENRERFNAYACGRTCTNLYHAWRSLSGQRVGPWPESKPTHFRDHLKLMHHRAKASSAWKFKWYEIVTTSLDTSEQLFDNGPIALIPSHGSTEPRIMAFSPPKLTAFIEAKHQAASTPLTMKTSSYVVHYDVYRPHNLHQC